MALIAAVMGVIFWRRSGFRRWSRSVAAAVGTLIRTAASRFRRVLLRRQPVLPGGGRFAEQYFAAAACAWRQTWAGPVWLRPGLIDDLVRHRFFPATKCNRHLERRSGEFQHLLLKPRRMEIAHRIVAAVDIDEFRARARNAEPAPHAPVVQHCPRSGNSSAPVSAPPAPDRGAPAPMRGARISSNDSVAVPFSTASSSDWSFRFTSCASSSSVIPANTSRTRGKSCRPFPAPRPDPVSAAAIYRRAMVARSFTTKLSAEPAIEPGQVHQLAQQRRLIVLRLSGQALQRAQRPHRFRIRRRCRSGFCHSPGLVGRAAAGSYALRLRRDAIWRFACLQPIHRG